MDDAFPVVVITAPADHRLMRDSSQAVNGSAEVRALVFGSRSIKSVACQVEDGEWTEMSLAPAARAWTAKLSLPSERLITITVQAVDEIGRPGQHTIRVATPAYVLPVRVQNGSDAASIGAWPENGIFGTQLGPNRNCKPPS